MIESSVTRPAPAGSTLEVELKYLAEDTRPLRRLVRRRRLGPARLGPATVVAEVDRYLDTPDRRLEAAGWACRLRTRGPTTIVSLKGPPAAGSGMGFHRRPEIEGAANRRLEPGLWPASPAREHLLGLTGGQPLVVELALRQHRTRRDVAIGSRTVAVLTLDRVAVLRATRSVGTLLAVELELAPHHGLDRRMLDALQTALTEIPGLSLDPLTKLQHSQEMLRRAGT